MEETGAARQSQIRPAFAPRLLLGLAIVVSSPLRFSGQATQFVAAEIPVHDANGAAVARLQILEDNRLTPRLQKEMWAIGVWSFVLEEKDPLYKEFSEQPPVNAELHLVSSDGRVVDSKKLEAPLAAMEARSLGKGQEFFLVTVDLSVGFGSYAGLTTHPLAVDKTGFQWAATTDPVTHQVQPVVVGKTLKTAWKLVIQNGVADLYEIACRPNFPMRNDSDFNLRYTHFRYDGSHWVRNERSKPGFWESKKPFPPLTSFPKAVPSP